VYEEWALGNDGATCRWKDPRPRSRELREAVEQSGKLSIFVGRARFVLGLFV
jgi:hypothetical protein